MTRVMLVIFMTLTGGATYATISGLGAESSAVSKSMRAASAGRVGYIGGVK